tara:strand:- start:344 stop:544 length:201 start_codon:yes stop_codon:yes gene_type:complete
MYCVKNMGFTPLDVLLASTSSLLDRRLYPKVFDEMTDKDNLIIEKAAEKILDVMAKYNLLSDDDDD